MAKEWYLIEQQNNYLSGYEKETFDEYAEDSFLDILNSQLSSTVELYNYDLSEHKQVKAVIQNRLADTKLKSLNRQMLTAIGTVKAGTYVKYKGRFWLVVSVVDDNGLFEKSVIMICNYHLTWINSNGEVIQRWANIASASQYNNGETSTRYYYVRSDQLIIILPYDDECTLLSSGQRFIIDNRCKLYEREFDDSVSCDTSNPVITYKVTRTDSVLYDYVDCGHNEIMVSQDEQQEQDGYYKIDGIGYWLCDVPNSTSTNGDKHCEIKCDSIEVYCSLEPTEFNAIFYDDYGNLVNETAIWDISGEFKELLSIYKSGSIISIFADDNRLLNKKFTLSLSADGYKSDTKEFIVKDFI